MAKKNKVSVYKDPNCLNCGFPFTKEEKFCPECGQKNKGKKITFGSFVREVFAGFFSWDAKFWRTIYPLLIIPGKVSRDYIDGKRIRYVNPFRFYITASIIFFLIFGTIKSYERFDNISKGIVEKDIVDKVKEANVNVDMDSVATIVNNNLANANIGLDSITRAEIKKEIKKAGKQKKDSANLDGLNFNIGSKTAFEKIFNYQSKHPETSINDGLDSLKLEKTFFNKFLYNRAKAAKEFNKSKEKRDEFISQMISYASVSMFILLPIFALFLKLFYIRRKFTYVEHLIFVFHTQTVFFILLTLLIILDFATGNSQWMLFTCLFLVYLFIALKRFYKQGYFKTFIKFCLLNQTYLFLASIGVAVIALMAFAVF